MTTIQWTNETLNPIRARNKETGGVGHFCVKVDPACTNCYAEPFQRRVKNNIRYAAQDLKLVDLFLDEKVLRRPLGWKSPRMIFVCSMTDLFGEFVPDRWIDLVLAVAALTPWHTYQLLTKRVKRLHDYMTLWPDGAARRNHVFSALLHVLGHNDAKGAERDEIVRRAQTLTSKENWPLRNVWQGVSAGTQETLDGRLPLLLRTPVALRWLSAEPILENLDIAKTMLSILNVREGRAEGGLDWVVVGGESGNLARTTNLLHVQKVVLQCEFAKVPVFVKQLGARPIDRLGERLNYVDSKGGDPIEWPLHLRVRQWPQR